MLGQHDLVPFDTELEGKPSRDPIGEGAGGHLVATLHVAENVARASEVLAFGVTHEEVRGLESPAVRLGQDRAADGLGDGAGGGAWWSILSHGKHGGGPVGRL